MTGIREVSNRPTVAMMCQGEQSPDWPLWPRLPLLNREREDGFLVDGDGPRVYLGNVFTTTDVTKLPCRDYNNFQEIDADGWTVD